MTHRERFRAVFNGEKPDRLPVYFFGSWEETKKRWKAEGLETDCLTGDPGPQVPGMDPDWEADMWGCQGLALPWPYGDGKYEVLEETEDYVTYRTSLGAIEKAGNQGESISHTIKHCLEPNRESWERFKTFLNPNDARRRPAGWETRAEEINKSDRVLGFLGGTLYGWLRNYMGVEAISCLMYDDSDLFSEMVAYMADFFMAVYEPVLKKVRVDLAYFFEDCCGSSGPLFSPRLYDEFFDVQYKRMIRFYKDNGVAFTMLDSDGKVDRLIPGWLKSGFDIVFPIEVGSWHASPVKLREQFGNSLRMLGGVDKHAIPKGEAAIREHLLSLKPAVDQGGYLPIPDHRIPPDCSYADFQIYLRVFDEVFNSIG